MTKYLEQPKLDEKTYGHEEEDAMNAIAKMLKNVKTAIIALSSQYEMYYLEKDDGNREPKSMQN